jgi:hypothetical protein
MYIPTWYSFIFNVSGLIFIKFLRQSSPQGIPFFNVDIHHRWKYVNSHNAIDEYPKKEKKNKFEH